MTYYSILQGLRIKNILIGAILFAMFFPRALYAQSLHQAPPVAQSPYYDAIALYFTMKGYKVYPMKVDDLSKNDQQFMEKQANSGDNTKKIESTVNRPVMTPAGGGGAVRPPSGANNGFSNGGTASPQKPDTSKKKADTEKAAAPPLVCYRLIECATGKIIIDTCVTSLDSLLMQYRYSLEDSGLRNDVLDSILFRNMHMAIAAGDTSSSTIRKSFNDNKYIAPLLDAFMNVSFAEVLKSNEKLAASADGIPLGTRTDLIGGAGKNGITNLIEGYTDFLIERVNEEFNDAFLVHLYHALNKISEFRILFPNTLESLDKIKLTNYSASLNAVKAAYESDIKEVLSNLGQLATLPRYQRLIEKYQLLTTLFAGADIMTGIHQKVVPAELLYQLGRAPYITLVKPNDYSSIIRLAAVFSNSLRDIQLGNENPQKAGWIGKEKLIYVRDNAGIFQIFMGLIAQGSDSIRLSGKTFKQMLNDNMGPIMKGQFIAYNFLKSASKIEDIVAKLQSAEGKTLKPSDYVSGFIDLSTELIGLSSRILDVLPTDKETLKLRGIVTKANNDYLPLLREADTVLTQVEAKNYSMAIYTVDRMIQKILSDAQARKSETAAAVKNEKDVKLKDEKQADAHYAAADADSTGLLGGEFLHYGLFIASVAEAKSAADVKDAINAFALPKGSSRIKKEMTFTVGLNAYVGVYHAWNKSYKGLKLPNEEWGITAPLGVGVNWAVNKMFGLHQWSMSAYGGIFDVGAIFTYKVQNDTLKSDIQLGQIFSPSAGFIIGLPIIHKYNIPLSIGANIQWGPRLHTVSDAGNSIFPLLTRRFNVFLAFDLPIVNFYTSRTRSKE